MATQNSNASRMIPPQVPRLKEFPPFPTLEESCPDLVRRFPELREFDRRAKQWIERIKQGNQV